METNNYNFNNVDTKNKSITISDIAEYEHLQMMRDIYENHEENYMALLSKNLFDNQDFYIIIRYGIKQNYFATGLSTYFYYDNTGNLKKYVDPYGNYIDGDDVHIVTNVDNLPLEEISRYTDDK